jgi:alpha-amylase
VSKKEDIVNIFMDYETFGEHQLMDSGIFNFLRALPKRLFKQTDFIFSTPSEVADELQAVAKVDVVYPISWADEERDLTAWLGNELQVDAFNKLYSLTGRVNKCDDPVIIKDWKYLQSSDHFYYMCTKFFSDGEVHAYFNPYESPYDAYINYMNILSDFIMRLNASVPETSKDKELSNLSGIITEKDNLIKKYEAEIKKLKTARSQDKYKSTKQNEGKSKIKPSGKKSR